MRVLHFGKFATLQFGGIETHVRALTEGLAASGVDVVNLVYDLARRSGPVRASRVNGVEVVSVPCRGTIASLPIAPAIAKAVADLARRSPFDVAHAHFPDPLAFVAMPISHARRRIASWHSDIVRQRSVARAFGFVARHAFAPLDAVAGATGSHLRSPQIEAFRPRARYVVPYGIEVGRFDADARVRERAGAIRASAAGRPIVFAVGRHVYYKGFADLVDAMREVDAVLMLGGEGPLTESLRQRAAARGGRGEIRFVGRIEDDDLPAWFHASSLFCFPSTEASEAFGIAQLEAMACGRPIVNCALGNAVNQVSPAGVTALTVPPRDPHALADAIGRLLADAPLRDRLGRAGRERVATQFSRQAMIEATLDMYERVTRPTP